MKRMLFIFALWLALAGCEQEVVGPEPSIPNFAATAADSLYMEVQMKDSTALFQITVSQDGYRLSVRSVDDGRWGKGGYLYASDYPSGWGIALGAPPQEAYWGPVVGDHAAEGVAVVGGSVYPPREPKYGSFRIFFN